MTGRGRRQFSTLGGTGFHPEGRGQPEPSDIQQGQRQRPALGRTSPISQMGCGHLPEEQLCQKAPGLAGSRILENEAKLFMVGHGQRLRDNRPLFSEWKTKSFRLDIFPFSSGI